MEDPLTERVVTVSGDAVENPGNFRVLLGTNHRELIEAREDSRRNRRN